MSHLDEGTLQALLDGEISSNELVPVQAHLDHCAECQAKLAEARQFMVEADQLIGLIEVPAPAAARTGAAPVQRIPRPRLRWAGPVGLAAAAVLALGVGSLAVDRLNDPRESLATPVFPGAVTSEARKATVRDSQPVPATVASPAPAVAAGPEDALDRADQPRRSSVDSRRRLSAANKVAQSERPADEVAERFLAKDTSPAARQAPVPAPPRLEELAVTGRASAKAEGERRADSIASGLGKVQAAAPASFQRAEADRLVRPLGLRDKKAATLVTADEALRTLGGSIKLIDGLMPKTFELVADRIRVIYPMSWGPLVLEEWREAGELRYRLIPPAGMSADSLAVLAARIR